MQHSFTTVMAKSFQTAKICISYTLFLHFPALEVCQRASTWWPGLSPWAHPFVSPPPTGRAGCSVCWADSWLPRLAVGKEPELMCKVEKYWIEIVRLNSTHSSGVIFGESVVGILSIPMASCTEFFLSGPEGLFPELQVGKQVPW